MTRVVEHLVARVEPGLTLHALQTFEHCGLAEEEWDDFVAASGSDFSLSFDWCRVWWAHYGKGRILRILVLRSGQELVGLVPMFIDRVGLPGARLRIAKFVGSDSTIAVLRPAIAEGWPERVAAAVITHMVDVEGCDAVWFGPLSGEPPYTETFRAACAAHAGVDLVRDISPGVHSIFGLPNSFDAYIRCLEKRHRDNFKRSFKQLQTRFSITHELVDSKEELLQAFDGFMDLHSRQWAALNNLGHFGDWPGSTEFTRDLIQASSRHGRASFAHISADNRIITRMHMFRFGKHLHWRLPAREIGEEWDRLSLGNIALVNMLEFAALHGLTRIEAGPGHYEQKVRYGAVEYPLASLLVVRRGAWPRLRSKVFCAWADLLHLLYYRIWRLRIAPRLPLRQRPLWKSWIRSRL